MAGRRVYRQVKNEDGSFGLVELTKPSAPLSSDLRFDGNFVSPVDGTVINSKYALNEHNKRNNTIQCLPGMNEDIASINKANRDDITGKRGRGERIEAIKYAIEKGERNA